jgi:hypothetical protein
MRTEKLISDLVKPHIISGVYKDETSALKDIIADYIEPRKEMYERKNLEFKTKYGKDFEVFTHDIKNRATIELEADWMEWKGEIEMKRAYEEALRRVISGATKV